MEGEEGARKSGNPEVVLNDRDGTGVLRALLPYPPLVSPGSHLPSHTNSASSQKVGMDTATPERPTWPMGLRKHEEGDAVPERKNGPLNLLDLPADILKEIFSQVSYTSDLTSLALTHSALHRLAIPMIYARFSIVWPVDEGPPDSDTVDALTYGLTTLVMGEDLFDKRQSYQKAAGQEGYCRNCTCEHCQKVASDSQSLPVKRVRRGNRYAQYTRSFCLGNGPQENVQEYHIKREGGKMLGTLSALSLARMPNLEIFRWDMPTGIVRDVWASLSCASTQLQRVWVRFHDNRSTGEKPTPSEARPVAHMPPPAVNTQLQNSLWRSDGGRSESLLAALELSYGRIEHPSFSILPPLQSLSVLDIDELAYAEEMSVLIGKSIDTLRRLRISAAPFLLNSGGWLLSANASAFLSGMVVTVMIFSKVNQDFGQPIKRFTAMETSPPLKETSPFASVSQNKADAGGGAKDSSNNGQTQTSLTCEPTTQAVPSLQLGEPRKLHLQVLEIERLVLSPITLQNAIDWTMVTSLTLLRCGNHEQLWRGLRTAFSPRTASPVFPQEFSHVSSDEAVEILSHSSLHSFMQNSWKESASPYRLNLKRIHTDTVSPSLITFLKETLAPNSLEWMFLQDGRDYSSTVKLDAIFQGPIRRHRGSLTKMMIDSAIGKAGQASNQQRKKWIFNTDLLAFVMCGKMSLLQELAMSLDYKDWHFFVRSLPRMPQIRSLHIPYIAHHRYSRHLKIRDLASQIADLVSLRPEVQLCYLGLEDSCFQLIENKTGPKFPRSTLYDLDTMEIDDTSEFNESDNEENQDEDDPIDDVFAGSPPGDDTEAGSVDGAEGPEEIDEDGSDNGKEEPAVTIRPILFYDSFVSIFKARHGEIRL